ncbi:monooxygenase [Verrucomicrobia bacterium LW23]|nr:monooxygenase [Verrucomicrobia bacterium LW23]
MAWKWPASFQPGRVNHTHINTIVVGAGAAGVGLGVALQDYKAGEFLIVDRHCIGASFLRWPKEMRLITPSFNTTPFGILDLNAVMLHTSVANFLGAEHPTGKQYAHYLQQAAIECQLPVQAGIDIVQVEAPEKAGTRGRAPTPSGPGTTFRLTCRDGSVYTADNVIWAAGEFQYPRTHSFPGAAHCLHNSQIASFQELPGRDRIVIGAFESGVDAAVHLVRRGVHVTLLHGAEQLATQEQDPSRSLSPFTRERLAAVTAERSNLRVLANHRVTEVKRERGGYTVCTVQGSFFSEHQPILATGFVGGVAPVKHLFAYRDDGNILLNEHDESTLTPGLFLAGPLVRHEHHIFCYIYKFRQRFAIVAESVARRLGLPVPDDVAATYHANQMRLEDLSCCGKECVC